MAEKLTLQQRMAVENRGGKLLVSAAAGSGKTKVLVDRLLSYLTDPDDPANLDEFLIITYTKAAASELRGKIAAKLTERIAEDPENRHLQKQLQRLYLTQISTVHSFCSNVLREYAYRLDLPADFRVAEEAECRELQETVLAELLDRTYENQENHPHFNAFVDTQGLGRDDRQIPDLVIKVYNSARCHMYPDRWLDACGRSVDIHRITDASQTVWGRYLMDSLFEALDSQIFIFKSCIQAMSVSPRMEKPTARILDVLYQLEHLRAAASWDEVCARKNITYGTLTFPRKDVEALLVERVKAVWAACKESLKKKLVCFTDDSAQVLSDLNRSGEAAEGLIDLTRDFMAEYSRIKRSRRILDFSDLEHRMLDLLLGSSRSGETQAAAEIGSRFREIMVDEYQDSNQVQDAIFSALTSKRQNCFMVGDVKQSIYQFRLAEPQIFLDKYDAYVPAEDADGTEGRRIQLSHNFRSGGEIIEAVNDIFTHCMTRRTGGLDYGEEEALREGIPHTSLPDPGVELFIVETEDTGRDEPTFVAKKIQEMLRKGTLIRDGEDFRPVTPEDIVILLRSAKNTAPLYQKALEGCGIRCNAGENDLLKAPEIAVLRSLLQTVSNPRQDIPLVSVLASPVFGFTADDLARFRQGKKKCALYDALLQSDLPKAADFLRILDVLRKEARMNTLSQLVERCFSLTRLDSIYAAMPGGSVRMANLQQFSRMASDFEKTNLRGLDAFLEHLEAAEEKGLKSDSASPAGSVTIMTVHASKGLEFPVVFLCGLARKFNTESSKEQILCDKELFLGLKTADTQNRIRYPSLSHRAIQAKMAADGISEEMRILYVAMTRARDRLIMTYASSNSEKTLKEMALRCTFDGGKLLCREASCPGTWVLLTALNHQEAGSIHIRTEVPLDTALGQFPWNIEFAHPEETAPAPAATWQNRLQLPENAETILKESLSFHYPHLAATLAPSKQTATGRKGRILDAEAAEDTQEPKPVERTWRSPTFLSAQKDGRAYGSAMHCAMQFIRYEACSDLSAVEQELRRMVAEGFLTREQGSMVNCSQIAAFFATPLGRKLQQGAPCLREFKFSILDDGIHYSPDLVGEQVLLQGVVDCALLESDGITVLDFKTDYVTEVTAPQAVARYRNQVKTYCDALTRIYRQPIKQSCLYFFRLEKFYKV